MAPIPEERTLEKLLGENKKKLEDPSLFLAFLRRTLKWVPEERPAASELLEDPWLRGQSSEEGKSGSSG